MAFWASIVTMLVGIMLSSVVHNPKMLVIGLSLVVVSQALMFYAGWSKARSQARPKMKGLAPKPS
jgi:hypothetical protein